MNSQNIVNDKKLFYYDRLSKQIREEPVERELYFLYHTYLGRWLVNTAFKQPFFSFLYGLYARSRLSKRMILPFVNYYEIEMSEFDKPLNHYTSFNDFFCRRLKTNMRIIDMDPAHFIAVCDGRLSTYAITDDLILTIKTSQVTISQLVQDDQLANEYRGGIALLFRLALGDYHHFIYPVSGTASMPNRIPGKLQSVHPIATTNHQQLFLNKRNVTVIHCDIFGTLMMIEIGAMTVGTIIQCPYTSTIKRGQDKGYFQIGGSAIVILIKKDLLIIDNDIIDANQQGLEAFVKLGARIGVRK